jgi:uncharacterized membrane protein (UPF0182 family)
MTRRLKILISIIIFVLLGFLILLFSGASIYIDMLWFESLGFLNVFWVIFLSNFGIKIIVGIVFALFIFFNLNFTKNDLCRKV